MRTATRWVASMFGLAAGLASIEHGIFEILQGNTRPEGLMIASIGPPCVPEEAWNACEPALTIIPNFLITGLLAVLLGLLVAVWGAAFVHRKHGGWVQIGMSLLMLLFGGGIFPPVIGIIGGIAGIKINAPVPTESGQRPGRVRRFLATLWPWPLVIFMIWVTGQWVVGYFFNDFLQANAGVSALFILALLPLSLYTAYAHDVDRALIALRK